MALIKCHECGKEISDTAKNCPHCGAKKKNKTLKRALYVLGALWVLGTVGSLLEKDPPPRSVRVTEEEYGEKWSFTVPAVVVACDKQGVGAITFVGSNGKIYSINGTAKAKEGHPYPNEIWRYDPNTPAKYKLRINLGPITERGQSLCPK